MEQHMRSPLATRVSALMEEILAKSGWLRSELRQLEQAGLGHRRMRDVCDLLDSLDSSIHWDLRDDLQNLSGRSPRQAARIIDSLDADIERLGRLIRRLDEECPDHPLARAAMIARAEIIRYFRDVENALLPVADAPLLQSCRVFARVPGCQSPASKPSSSPAAC